MSKSQINLPKTAFSMKASLPTKEPLILEKWEKNKIFERLRKNSKGRRQWEKGKNLKKRNTRKCLDKRSNSMLLIRRRE